MLESRSSPRFDSGNGALAVAAVAIGGVYWLAETRMLGGRSGFPLDDSWIHLQLARRLAAGEGLAYQGGRWLPASTAPLWTALLAAGGGSIAWAKTLGIGLYAATAVAASRLGGEMGLRPGLRLLAGALALATPWLAWSALSGMEILLFATLGLAGTTLHLRERRDPERPPASLAVLALATLARPEGALLLLLAAAVDALSGPPRARRLRRLAEGTALAAIVLAPVLLFNRATGGSFLPTTHAVKAPEVRDLVPSGRYLATAADFLLGATPAAFVLAVAGVVVLVLAARPWDRDRGLVVAAWPLALVLAFAVLAGDAPTPPLGNFGRYLFPLLPFLAVLAAAGLEPVAARLAGRGILAAVLAAALLLPGAWGLYRGIGRYLQTVANVEASDVAAARWLAGRLPTDALLAVQDVGALKVHLPNPVLDLAGIVTPEVLPVLRGAGNDSGAEPWEERLLRFLGERRPELLVVFPRSYPRLVAKPGFAPVARFPVPHNVTMAGDELVVFATPWTRPGLAADLAPPGS